MIIECEGCEEEYDENEHLRADDYSECPHCGHCNELWDIIPHYDYYEDYAGDYYDAGDCGDCKSSSEDGVEYGDIICEY
jgi:DNA-directed RNA polymerase subunit RPC12/RpoP